MELLASTFGGLGERKMLVHCEKNETTWKSKLCWASLFLISYLIQPITKGSFFVSQEAHYRHVLVPGLYIGIYR
jgi:hypothetical protein